MSCLVILAAGLGSRFGDAKQLAEFGPLQRTLMEYNICHAYDQGFSKVIFIVQKKTRSIIEKTIAPRLPPAIEVCIAEQDNFDLPQGCSLSEQTKKPLGTAHALWCARQFIDSYFCVINGDDYYSKDAFKRLADSSNTLVNVIVAFQLDKTLSKFGEVNRGLCEVNVDSASGLKYLKSVQECINIKQEMDKMSRTKKITGKITISLAQDDKSEEFKRITLNEEQSVSMNCWGFQQTFIHQIERTLLNHFSELKLSSECYLPDAVMQSLTQKSGNVNVIKTKSNWFGLTYQKDKAEVESKISELTKNGIFGSLPKRRVTHTNRDRE